MHRKMRVGIARTPGHLSSLQKSGSSYGSFQDYDTGRCPPPKKSQLFQNFPHLPA